MSGMRVIRSVPETTGFFFTREVMLCCNEAMGGKVKRKEGRVATGFTPMKCIDISRKPLRTHVARKFTKADFLINCGLLGS